MNKKKKKLITFLSSILLVSTFSLLLEKNELLKVLLIELPISLTKLLADLLEELLKLLTLLVRTVGSEFSCSFVLLLLIFILFVL